MITDYHAKYFAYELTRRAPSDSLEKLTSSLSDAQVDLNPHQIDAALFAFRSPFAKGVILADEVGLGKTIEAGIVLTQKWAEGKRKVLVIVPSSLRKQWNQELLDKFFLSSILLEAKSFNQSIKQGKDNPFNQNEIVICSYHFARNKADFIKLINWDLVIIDEAHRLRNVYRKANKIARAIKEALFDSRKILLTATPLQNSLLELYGLVSFIDDYTFGDVKSYKDQFLRLSDQENFDDLKSRIAPICKRTLRRQVLEYIRYTNRIPITQEFIPTQEEQTLYDYITEYLRKEMLYALPSSQRQLITLILRKLLSSSTFAITGTLNSLIRRLQHILSNASKVEIEEEINEDYESFEETKEEWQEDENVNSEEKLTQEDLKTIQSEIEELMKYRDLAESITHNAKGSVLLTALKMGFAKAKELGANEKAIIFTESRRTQQYILKILSETEYKSKIILFNGSNNDEISKQIYKNWILDHQGTDRITGSKSADIRAAIVDCFKENASIMIATESAAEGINLQFCSLVVNYDLPWNPQRIEQRIGRCHRYGQKYDVVVVNFLNKKNAADQRIYELLSEKFKLFSGVFGASDEVLGSIESGINFEKRIAQIYQECRTAEGIQSSFDELQNELEEQINDRMNTTRQKLLENFDEEVHDKLRVNLRESTDYLNKYEHFLWDITKYYLDSSAEFIPNQNTFRLHKNPFPNNNIPIGLYRFGKNIEDAHIYRIGHPLAQSIINSAKSRQLSVAEVKFDYSNHSSKIATLEPLVGKKGWLSLFNFTIESLDTSDYLIFIGFTDDGKILEDDQCRRLFSLTASILNDSADELFKERIKHAFQNKTNSIIENINLKNGNFFDEEMDKLDKWAEDKKKSLRLNIKEIDDRIKELRREARTSANLPEKVKLQKQVKSLERRRDDIWKELDSASREVDNKKEELIDNIENRLSQNLIEEELFFIKWSII